MDINNKYGNLKIQQVNLRLLKDFDDFCVANNIVYSLDCGTLLGAVREGGFIPWDNDIDLTISRSNFQKLERAMSKSDKLCFSYDMWLARITYKDTYISEPSIRIPEVSFFIMDYAPSNKFAKKIKLVYTLLLQQTFKERPDRTVRPFSKWLRLFIGWLFGSPFTQRQKYNYFNYVCAKTKPSKTVSCYGYWPQDMPDEYKYDIAERVHRQSFDGVETYVMDDFDYHLTCLYGDYMTPPQEKDRVTTHLYNQPWVPNKN